MANPKKTKIEIQGLAGSIGGVPIAAYVAETEEAAEATKALTTETKEAAEAFEDIQERIETKYTVERGAVCPGVESVAVTLPTGRKLFLKGSGEPIESDLELDEVSCLKAAGYVVEFAKPAPSVASVSVGSEGEE